MDDKTFQLLVSKLDDHDRKLDEILAWRWKLSGVTVVVATFCGIAVQIVIAVYSNK